MAVTAQPRIMSVAERLLLDIVRDIRHNLDLGRQPIPDRYDTEWTAARSYYSIMTASQAVALQVQRPINEPVMAALAIVADTGTDRDRAAIAKWVQAYGKPAPPDQFDWGNVLVDDAAAADLDRLHARLPYLAQTPSLLDVAERAADEPFARNAEVDLVINTAPALDARTRKASLKVLRDARDSGPSEATGFAATADLLVWSLGEDGEWAEIASRAPTAAERRAVEALRPVYGECVEIDR